MSRSLPYFQSPAERFSSTWFPSYFDRFSLSIKKVWAAVAKVRTGRDRRNVTEVSTAADADAKVNERDDREAILIKLIFATRRLAESRVGVIDKASLGCLECEQGFVPRFGIPHRKGCLAGEVLGLLNELQDAVAPAAPEGGAE